MLGMTEMNVHRPVRRDTAIESKHTNRHPHREVLIP
jgi:hypothetical protein